MDRSKTMEYLNGFTNLPDRYWFRSVKPVDQEAVQRLFVEIHQEFGFEAQFENRDHDLSNNMVFYAHPGNFFGVLLEKSTQKIIGTAAIKRIDAHTGELARIYLDKDYRQQGLGRWLTEILIELAREFSYKTVVLETHTSLDKACGLYESLGFQKIPPYKDLDTDYTDIAYQLTLSNYPAGCHQ